MVSKWNNGILSSCTNYSLTFTFKLDYISDECAIYTEQQCQTTCYSTDRLGEFNADSTCPCKCKCLDFVQSRCQKKCQEEEKVTALGFTDQFGCLRCKCDCPPYHNTGCQNQCTQEDKIHIPGAKSRFGCDICQCGCLNRDCNTECGDLEFRVVKGSQGCTVGCRCICADDCEPNCLGCIPPGNCLHAPKKVIR